MTLENLKLSQANFAKEDAPPGPDLGVLRGYAMPFGDIC